MTRTSTRVASASPTGRTSLSCRTRRSFACSVERQLADLVQEERAAVGLLETGLAVSRSAPVNAPLLVAEQLALEQRLRNAAAVDGHERLAGALPLVVDAARDQLFAGAAFAQDEHGGRVARRLAREFNTLDMPGLRPTMSPKAKSFSISSILAFSLRFSRFRLSRSSAFLSVSKTSSGLKGLEM